MPFYLGTGGSATIKHRCVTHLYGRNAMEQLVVISGQWAVERSEINSLRSWLFLRLCVKLLLSKVGSRSDKMGLSETV